MAYSKKPVFQSALDFDGRSLALYREKIAEQNQLLRIVRTALPTSIAEHADHCVLNGGRLQIYTVSAVWASQIRFFNASILNKLHECGQAGIARIQVKVLPLPDQFPESVRSARLPSAETVQAMLASVDEKSEDSLDKAMAKLANTLLKCLKK